MRNGQGEPPAVWLETCAIFCLATPSVHKPHSPRIQTLSPSVAPEHEHRRGEADGPDHGCSRDGEDEVSEHFECEPLGMSQLGLF